MCKFLMYLKHSCLITNIKSMNFSNYLIHILISLNSMSALTCTSSTKAMCYMWVTFFLVFQSVLLLFQEKFGATLGNLSICKPFCIAPTAVVISGNRNKRRNIYTNEGRTIVLYYITKPSISTTLYKTLALWFVFF